MSRTAGPRFLSVDLIIILFCFALVALKLCAVLEIEQSLLLFF